MPVWLWIIGGVVGLIALIGCFQYRARSGTYTSLSSRQPARRPHRSVPLGMEATDMNVVNDANRRNESLERGQTNWMNRGAMEAATDVPPMADDETYAKRFHTAFIKDKK